MQELIDLVRGLFSFIMHIDTHLTDIIAKYGAWTYGVLFLIIFCETGLVVMPLLPGDSLLFAAGTFAARGALDPFLLIVLLCIAAIAGDTVNYWVGHYLGPKLQKSRFINPKHLEKTHAFYEKHGGKTIVIARFMPIIRTFAPFVAGIGGMDYKKFLFYNVTGGVLWISLFVMAGFLFGNIPWVAENFTAVIMAIIVISVMPAVIEYVKSRRKKIDA